MLACKLCGFNGQLTSFAKKKLYFCDFIGRGVRIPSPPLDPHMLSKRERVGG